MNDSYPKDGDRYTENPDFVWVAELGKWMFSPEQEDEDDP